MTGPIEKAKKSTTKKSRRGRGIPTEGEDREWGKRAWSTKVDENGKEGQVPFLAKKRGAKGKKKGGA